MRATTQSQAQQRGDDEGSATTDARLGGVSAGSELDDRWAAPRPAAACGIHGRRVTSAAFVAILRDAPGFQPRTSSAGGETVDTADAPGFQPTTSSAGGETVDTTDAVLVVDGQSSAPRRQPGARHPDTRGEGGAGLGTPRGVGGRLTTRGSRFFHVTLAEFESPRFSAARGGRPIDPLVSMRQRHAAASSSQAKTLATITGAGAAREMTAWCSQGSSCGASHGRRPENWSKVRADRRANGRATHPRLSASDWRWRRAGAASHRDPGSTGNIHRKSRGRYPPSGPGTPMGRP